MSKYRITVENIGEGANWNKGCVECDGFVILGDQNDGADLAMHGVTDIDIAQMIATHKEMRTAARIALAMYESKMEDAHSNPFASIISSIRPIAEDD